MAVGGPRMRGHQVAGLSRKNRSSPPEAAGGVPAAHSCAGRRPHLAGKCVCVWGGRVLAFVEPSHWRVF